MTRQEHLKNVGEQWEALKAVLQRIPREKMEIPETVGQWSIKDVMGHIATWDGEVLKMFEDWKAGRKNPWFDRNWKFDFDFEVDGNAWNQKEVEKKRPLSLDQITGELEETHRRMIALVETLPDDLFLEKSDLVNFFVESTWRHYPLHRQRLEPFAAG